MAIQAKTFTAAKDFICGHQYREGDPVEGPALAHIMSIDPALVVDHKPPKPSKTEEKEA